MSSTPENRLSGDPTGVELTTLGIDLMTVRLAPLGEIDRINVYSQNPALSLVECLEFLGLREPLIIGSRQAFAVNEHGAHVLVVLGFEPRDSRRCDSHLDSLRV
jgi:hypothetical protein